MPRCQARVPCHWLMTDERLGDDLWCALRRLPRGGGVVFRHYQTPERERRRMFRRVRAVALARGLVLVRAGARPLPGEQGTHARRRRGHRLVTWPVHNAREMAMARRARASVFFVSPIFPTRSHPGAPVLGVRGAVRLARQASGVRIALGGMNARRFLQLANVFDGWAAIDGWTH